MSLWRRIRKILRQDNTEDLTRSRDRLGFFYFFPKPERVEGVYFHGGIAVEDIIHGDGLYVKIDLGYKGKTIIYKFSDLRRNKNAT